MPDIDIIYSLKDGIKLSFDKYMEIEEELKKAFNTKIDLINVKREIFMKPTKIIPTLDWRQGNAIVSTISSQFQHRRVVAP
jgi:hypothetical protein